MIRDLYRRRVSGDHDERVATPKQLRVAPRRRTKAELDEALLGWRS